MEWIILKVNLEPHRRKVKPKNSKFIVLKSNNEKFKMLVCENFKETLNRFLSDFYDYPEKRRPCLVHLSGAP
ncbi:hypothetical protein, partial [Clostridium sp. CTA-19]